MEWLLSNLTRKLGVCYGRPEKLGGPGKEELEKWGNNNVVVIYQTSDLYTNNIYKQGESVEQAIAPTGWSAI